MSLQTASPPALDRAMAVTAVLGVACLLTLSVFIYSFVGTFVFGIFIYYSVRPIYRVFRRVVPSGGLAAFLSMFALALPALLVVFYAVTVAVNDFGRLLTNQRNVALLSSVLDRYVTAVPTAIDPEALLSRDIDVGLVVQSVTIALDILSQSFSLLGLGVIHLFIMLTLAFYLLRDGDQLASWGRNWVSNDALLAYGQAVDRDLRNVYFGNIANAAATGAIGVIAYTLLNVYLAPRGAAIPYPALLGMLTGVASLIPMVGMKLVYVPVSLYLTGTLVLAGREDLLWFVAAFVLVSLVVVDTVPDIVLRPFVSGGTLHSGTLMLTYVLGSLLFGWYGIFLAPLLLVVTVEFVRVLLPQLLHAHGDDVVVPTELTAGAPASEWTADVLGRSAEGDD
ncbi:Predicted PurR-regulated permease PerM [Halogranum gelatinilyticum]|uniref:Predicted PurR-regulated permease PerM n=1 Tax=Halogranum gelatinilyticum TaxID=660521 RepID=A0A1G9XFU1_9EURY|nr:AI-2E family transporter [Halogranum gelatinilyticum]SDM95608.1 Predicted PurR-regulated permease PerM [Halogranum gelatinilyticum]